MIVTVLKTGKPIAVTIEKLLESDFALVDEDRFHFNWRTEKNNWLYKLILVDSEEILGVMSIKLIQADKRIEIVLLATSITNTGKNKFYEGIAGNLIAYACRESIKVFAEYACVSLLPKTELKQHYINKYGMLDAGRHVYLEGISLLNLIKNYKI